MGRLSMVLIIRLLSISDDVWLNWLFLISLV